MKNDIDLDNIFTGERGKEILEMVDRKLIKRTRTGRRKKRSENDKYWDKLENGYSDSPFVF